MEFARKERFGYELFHLMNKLTLVMDKATTLLQTVEERASSARLPFGWMWLSWNVQKFNTALKFVIESEKAAGFRVHSNLELVKEILRTFKERG